jgi:hypothetical protein
MTVLAIVVVSPQASARADERAPPSLIELGIRARLPGTESSERAVAAASFLPELRLRAIFEYGAWPGRSFATTTVLGELAWPLGRTPAGDAIAGEQARRQRASARETLVARIATAWHERRRAEEAADDVAAELAAEQADAELDALVGLDDEDAP